MGVECGKCFQLVGVDLLRIFQTPLYNFLCKFRAQLLPMLTTTVWLHNCNHKFACSQNLNSDHGRRLLEISLSKLFPHTPLGCFLIFPYHCIFVFSVFQPSPGRHLTKVQVEVEVEEQRQGGHGSWTALQFPLHLQPS